MSKARELAELSRTVADSADAVAITVDSNENTTFTGVVTANAGVVVDNITIDGTTLALSSGDLTLDVAGDIVLDAGGVERFNILSGGNITIKTVDAFLYSPASSGGTTIDAGFKFESSNQRLEFWTADVERMSIASNGAATFSSNVNVTGSVTASGIDINGAAPYIKFLDTSGDAYAKIDADSPDEGTIRIQADPSNSGANSIIRFDVDGSERLRIDGTGKVGIGASAPITSLTLGTGTTGLSFQSSATTLNSGKIAVIKPVELGNGNGHLVFETYEGGSGGGERMRISSTGSTSFTLSTDAKGSFYNTISEVGTGTFALQVTNSAESALKPFGIRAEDIRFATGSAERMRIDSSGNASIGTSSSFGKLRVEDTGWSSGSPYGTVAYILGGDVNDANWGHLLVSQSGTTTGSGGKISFGANGDNPIAGIKAYYAGATYGHLDFYTRPSGGTSTQRMRIASNGVSTFSAAVLSPSFVATAGGTFTTASGNDLNIVYPSGRSLFIKEAGETHVTVDNVGNVGLGTTNPAAYGQFTVSGAGNLVNLNAESGKAYQGFFEGGTGRFYLSTLDGSKGLAFVDGNGATERGRFDASGNFLVRQSSPQVSDTHNGGTVEQFWGNQFSSSNSTNTKVMIGTGSNEGYVGASRLSSSGQYVINSYIRFDNTNATAGSDAGQIKFFTQSGGTNAAERMRIRHDGVIKLATDHGIKVFTGYFGAGTASASFDAVGYGAGVMMMTAAFNHYGYIAGYGCYKRAICSNGPGHSGTTIEVNNVDTAITSTAGGSWTFHRTNGDTTGFRVTKNAGNYAGGGYYWVRFEGNMGA